MIPSSFFDELRKLAAVSDEEALAAINRAEKLQQNKPTIGQLGRYAAIGGTLGTGIKTLGTAIEHGGTPKFVEKMGPRGLAASAVTGALGASLIPMARHYADQQHELGTLKRYVDQHQAPAVPLEASDTTPMPKTAGMGERATQFLLQNPHTVGGAFGGLSGSGPGDGVGGALAGGAAAHGAVLLSESLGRKGVLDPNQAALARMIAQYGSPLVGGVGGALYTKAKRGLLGSSEAPQGG